MNWKECARMMEGYYPGWRLNWPSYGWTDLDCEKAFTISDVWGGFMWGLTWPGDWLLSQDPLRTFFQIEGATAIGATGSIFFGILFWWLAIALVFGILESAAGLFVR